MMTLRTWIVLLTAVFLFGCTSNAAEPSWVGGEATEEAAATAEEACLESTNGRSLGLFMQGGRTIMVNGFELTPGDTHTLRITAVTDEDGTVIERQSSVNEEGIWSETVELPRHDYMRWNIRLHLEDGALCHYLIMGGDEWLEQGTDRPQTAAEADAMAEDMALIAEQLGVSPDDLARQMANEAAMTELRARLEANEAESFTGLWVEWEPSYRIVLSFTENGEETVARYLDEDSPLWADLEIRSGTFTQAELEADQQALFEIMETAAFDWGSAIDVQRNRVELSVPTEAIWTAFVAENQIELPPSVVVNFAFTEDEVTFVPPSNLNPLPEIFMAQRQLPSMMMQSALLTGELLIEDGCVFANSPDGRQLIVWQPGFFVHEAEGGAVQILDEAGEVVAENGRPLYMGGGEGLLNDIGLAEPVPERCQTERVWYMGDFLPAEYRPDAEEDAG